MHSEAGLGTGVTGIRRERSWLGRKLPEVTFTLPVVAAYRSGIVDRFDAIFLPIFGAGLSALALALVYREMTSISAKGILAIAIGIGMFLVGIDMFASSIRRMFGPADGTPIISIDAVGIQDLRIAPEPVPWKAVASVRIAHAPRAKFATAHLRVQPPVAAGQSEPKRLLNVSTFASGATAVRVRLHGFDVAPDALAAVIVAQVLEHGGEVEAV